MSLLGIRGKEPIADWVETTLLARGKSMSHDAIAHAARDELQATDDQVGLALGALTYRANLLGGAYPFEPLDVAVKLSAGARSSPYSLLLLLTPGSPARSLLNPSPSQESAEIFERTVALAVQVLLGEGSQAIRFGWPSDEGRPPEFNLAIGWLGGGFRQPKRMDGGVDVIAWRPFPDRRKGFPIWLVQCTVQEKFVNKARDVDLRLWSSWLGFDTEPVAALAIPGTVPKKTDWDEIALRCVTFDRIRLSGLLLGRNVDEIPGAAPFARHQIDQLAERLHGAGGWD